MKSAVIAGVGPLDGLGAALCQRFASCGLHVYVAGRSPDKLERVVAEIESEGGSASPVSCDTKNEVEITRLFEMASKKAPVDLAIYNVGNSFPGQIIDMDAEYFEEAWRSVCFGGFLFGREAARHMSKEQQGTVIFTGASASLRGKANYAAFNSSKSALRTFAQALAKEAGPNGIHIAHVIIDGSINGEKIKTRHPDYAEKLQDGGMISLGALVDAYEYLYKQEKTGWSFELDLRTAIESW